MFIPPPQRIFVLVNPQAGLNRRGFLDTEVISDLLGRQVEIVVTGSLKELEGAILRVFEQGADLLVVSGGDGTLHLLATKLLNSSPGLSSLPAILILRGGTMNMVYGNVGTGRAPLMELRVLGHVLQNGLAREGLPVREVRPLKVRASGLSSPLYGFVFANGIAFNILREYYRGTPSPARAFQITASIIAGAFMSKELERRYFATLPANIEIDGKIIATKSLRIAVASAIPKLLLWFTVFEGRQVEPSKFFFLANFMKTREIARNFWGLCRGTYEGDGHINGQFQRVTIRGGGGFTIDGEVYEVGAAEDWVEIESGPPFRFLDLSPFAPPEYTWSRGYQAA